VRYMKKSSFSLKETLQIYSKILENVKFLYFKLFLTVLRESESISNEISSVISCDTWRNQVFL